MSTRSTIASAIMYDVGRGVSDKSYGLTAESAEALGMPKDAKGLAVTDVDEASEAFTKGLRAGDVITEAGQQPVERLEDLETRLTEAKDAGRKSLLLLVRRAGDPRFVALSVEEQAPAEQ